jgi:predicted PurR-regulated permease PerM
MMQIGTGLVWIPIAIWLAYQDQKGWATFIVASGLFITIMDGFIQPYLISRQGASIPTILIFKGGQVVESVVGLAQRCSLSAIPAAGWSIQMLPAATKSG